MATRTGKQWSTSEAVTSANMNKGPQGTIGYLEVTATASSLSTTETELSDYRLAVTPQGTRNLRVTVTVHVKPAAGISVSGGAIAGNQQGTLRIRVGSTTGTVIGRCQMPTISADVATTFTCVGWHTSVSSSTTYYVTFEGYGLTTWETTNASTRPGFILVDDCGVGF